MGLVPAVSKSEDEGRIPTLVQGSAENDPETETRRELHRAVWMLAWPSVLTMMLQTVNGFTDRFFVGNLGYDALAAAGLGGQFMFLMFSVGMAIAVGTTALVARSAGAEEYDNAATASTQSVRICLIAAFFCVAVGLPFRHALVRMMGIDEHAAAMCANYLGITWAGIPFLFLMLVLSGVYRGLGDMVTPLLVMIVVNIIHLGGDYLLIFGHGGFPRMGLNGGAVALLASQVVGSFLYFVLLRRTVLSGRFHWARQLTVEWVRRILRIGIPAAIQNLSRVLSMLLFTGVLARTPERTFAVAALTIGLTSESIAFMPGIGFSNAASTLTGQNLGAGDPDRAEKAAWAALLQGLAIMTVMAVVFFTQAARFAGIFTHDPHVLRLAVAYLRTMAISEPFLAFGMILNGALNGAGDTRATAMVSIITMWGCRLPVAYVLIGLLHHGAITAWWTMAASTILNGLLAIALFKWGRWKHTTV